MYSFNEESIEQQLDLTQCSMHHQDVIKVCLQSIVFTQLGGCHMVRLCRVCIDQHDSSHQEINPYQLYAEVKQRLPVLKINYFRFEEIFSQLQQLREEISNTLERLSNKLQLQMQDTLDISGIERQNEILMGIDDSNYLQHIEVLIKCHNNWYGDLQLRLSNKEDCLVGELNKVIHQVGTIAHQLRDQRERKQSEQQFEEMVTFQNVLLGHENVVRSCIQLEDGDYATASRDKSIRIWSHKTTQCVQTIREHTNWVQDLIRLPECRFCSCSDDKSIRIFGRHQGNSLLTSAIKGWVCLLTLNGHECYVMRVVHNQLNDLIVSCSTDGTLRIWKGNVSDVLHGHTNSVYSLATNKNIIVSGDEGGDVIVWDIEQQVKQHTQRAHSGCVNQILIDTQIYTCGDDKVLKIWSLELEIVQIVVMLYSIQRLQKNEMESMAFINSTTIIGGDEQGYILIIDITKGTVLLEMQAHADRVYKIDYHNGLLCTASADHSAKNQYQLMNQTSKSFNYKSIQKTDQFEQLRRKTFKKILMMSSMEKDILNYIQKIFSMGLKYLQLKIVVKDDVETTPQKEIMKYGSNVLDRDRQRELEALMMSLNQQSDLDVKIIATDQFVQLIKLFILSPVERQYIAKIEFELDETKNLDDQIAAAQANVKEQQEIKLQEYKKEKEGIKIDKVSLQSQQQKIQVHENKLEKSNQKLNEIVAHNNQLREKINQLRKEKNMVEEIYEQLNQELEDKKKNVDKTIQSAGQAYYNRNRAEEELKQLQEKAERQKVEFDRECKDLNEKIQHDKKFKAFIQSKKKEQEILEKLEKQIQENQEIIKQKTASNAQIDKEYMLSASKEQEIKEAFERIKQETGIHDKKKERESKQLLTVFIELYQNNAIMSQFVKELQETVEDLERQIEEKKNEIQMYSTKGATNDNQRRELKMALSNKIQQEEQKKVILKAQYEKSIETINLIKKYLEEVFQAIDVDPETIDKLKGAAITEENMVHFLGILEQKGLDAIQEYARLIAEQLKLEKGDTHGLTSQIDDLNNIIAYENANIMNYYSQAAQMRQECPEDLLSMKEEEENEPVSIKRGGFLQHEDLKKQALDIIQKRSGNKKPTKQKFKESK